MAANSSLERLDERASSSDNDSTSPWLKNFIATNHGAALLNSEGQVLLSNPAAPYNHEAARLSARLKLG